MTYRPLPRNRQAKGRGHRRTHVALPGKSLAATDPQKTNQSSEDPVNGAVTEKFADTMEGGAPEQGVSKAPAESDHPPAKPDAAEPDQQHAASSSPKSDTGLAGQTDADRGERAASTAEDDLPDEGAMSIREHLAELRRRLIRSLLAALAGFAVCLNFSEYLFAWLAAPLTQVLPERGEVIFTRMAEGFLVDMKVAFIAGLMLTSPFIFYQAWAFVAPGLYREEKKAVLPLTALSALLFLAGAAFCYYGAFPIAFKFLMSFARGGVKAAITLDNYLGFALHLIFAFGLVFQLPLIIFFLAKIGLVTPAKLRAWRRYAIVAAFILSALLTPPDIYSQLFMVGPLILLYEFSILVAGMAKSKRLAPKPD